MEKAKLIIAKHEEELQRVQSDRSCKLRRKLRQRQSSKKQVEARKATRKACNELPDFERLLKVSIVREG